MPPWLKKYTNLILTQSPTLSRECDRNNLLTRILIECNCIYNDIKIVNIISYIAENKRIMNTTKIIRFVSLKKKIKMKLQEVTVKFSNIVWLAYSPWKKKENPDLRDDIPFIKSIKRATFIHKYFKKTWMINIICRMCEVLYLKEHPIRLLCFVFFLRGTQSVQCLLD